MNRRQLFWAVAAMAAAPLFAETTTGEYGFTYSTLARVGELAVRPTSEANDLSFTLSAETFDKAIELGTEWRPIVFVPPTVTVTALTIAVPGTDAPGYVRLTPAAEEGAAEEGAAASTIQFKLDPDATETVSLVGTDGIAHTATLRTYVSDVGVTLKPGQACGFDFDDTEVDATTRNFYTFGGVPHLRPSMAVRNTR